LGTGSELSAWAGYGKIDSLTLMIAVQSDKGSEIIFWASVLEGRKLSMLAFDNFFH